MWDVEASLKFLENAIEEIESYLLSQDIVWARSGRQSLSVGLVLLDLRWLGTAVEDASLTRFEEIELELSSVRDRWQVAWERKAAAELRSRLNLWRAYLADLEGRPGLATSYPQEVRNRAIALDLQDAAGNQPEIKTLAVSLDAIDRRFRDFFQPGDFIWEQVSETAFPAESFWFLYGKPQSRN